MTVKGAGKCKIDSVAVGDVSIDFFAPAGTQIVVKYAYVDGVAGARLGANHRNANWSLETYARAQSLLESLERDICQDLFEEGATSDGGPVLSQELDGQIPSL